MTDKLIQKPKLDPKASKFTLKIKRSKIHRYGVFTMEDIPKRTRVIEYTGERIAAIRPAPRPQVSLPFFDQTANCRHPAARDSQSVALRA